VVLSTHELAAGPGGGRVGRLVDGRLHDVSAGPVGQRVVLDGPGLDPQPLTDRGDVELVSFDRERGRLTVLSTDATGLLRAALPVGWSVVEVLR
jgi:hypothetical protein